MFARPDSNWRKRTRLISDLGPQTPQRPSLLATDEITTRFAGTSVVESVESAAYFVVSEAMSPTSNELRFTAGGKPGPPQFLPIGLGSSL